MKYIIKIFIACFYSASCEPEIINHSVRQKYLHKSKGSSIDEVSVENMATFIDKHSVLISLFLNNDHHQIVDKVKDFLQDYFDKKYDAIVEKQFSVINWSQLTDEQIKNISREQMKAQFVHYLNELVKLFKSRVYGKNTTPIKNLNSSNIGLIETYTGNKQKDLACIRDIRSIATEHYNKWKQFQN